MPENAARNLLTKLVGDMSEMFKTVFFHGYKAGVKAGIERYAWMKDGVTYVGTCGTTLKEAVAKVDQEESDIRENANVEFQRAARV